MTTHDSVRDDLADYLQNRVTAAEQQVRHHVLGILREMQDTLARLDAGGSINSMGVLQGKGNTLDTWCTVLNERREALATATRFLEVTAA